MQSQLTASPVIFAGGAENARLEIAELANAEPNCRTGKHKSITYEEWYFVNI